MQFAKGTILKIVCMIASFLASAATSSAQNEKLGAPIESTNGSNTADAIHDQLRALREDFIAAVNTMDCDAVVALLHPEVIVTAQDGKKLSVIRRHDGVRKYLNRFLVGQYHNVERLKLNPKVDPSVWLSDKGAPWKKLANEKPQGQTIDYSKLLTAWKAFTAQVTDPAAPWLVRDQHHGPEAVQAAYAEVLGGRSHPRRRGICVDRRTLDRRLGRCARQPGNDAARE